MITPEAIGTGIVILGMVAGFGAFRQKVRDIGTKVNAINPHHPPCKELLSYQNDVSKEFGDVKVVLARIEQKVDDIKRNGNGK